MARRHTMACFASNLPKKHTSGHAGAKDLLRSEALTLSGRLLYSRTPGSGQRDLHMELMILTRAPEGHPGPLAKEAAEMQVPDSDI